MSVPMLDNTTTNYETPVDYANRGHKTENTGRFHADISPEDDSESPFRDENIQDEAGYFSSQSHDASSMVLRDSKYATSEPIVAPNGI